MHLFCPSPKPSTRVIFQSKRFHLFVQFHMPCNSLLTSPMSEKLRRSLPWAFQWPSYLQTSCCWWSSLRAFWDTARAAKIMLSSEIIKSLNRKPCDSGVTRSMVSGRTGKDWLKIKRMISKLSELSSQSRYRLHLNNHLADAMLRPVWEEALKWRARKRCRKAPCAAITFICKFWLAPMGYIGCLTFEIHIFGHFWHMF